jgi:hypothetical protein
MPAITSSVVAMPSPLDLKAAAKPVGGEIWTHPNSVIGAQHAFHHIDNHLDKTALEYMLWRVFRAIGNLSKAKVGLIFYHIFSYSPFP